MSGIESGDLPDDAVEVVRLYFCRLAAQEVSANDDIFELGLVNSLRALEIVTHVERTYGIEITVDDLDLDNFRTAAKLAQFVEAKQGARAAGGVA